MEAFLSHRPAWYVIGPLIGLVVLGLLVTINERIGVLGGYVCGSRDLIEFLQIRAQLQLWILFARDHQGGFS